MISRKFFLPLPLFLVAALISCPSGSGGDDEPPAPPPAIASLTLEQVTGENAFTASWEPESEVAGITYELFHNESGTAPAQEASGLPVETTETKVSGLGGGKTYTAWVRAGSGTEKGPWSEDASITLKKDQTAMTFSIEVFAQTRFGQIQGDTIQVRVPINTPKPWTFTPQIALSEGATLISGPAIGAEADFGDPDNPVHYRVQAENGREQDYTVQMQTGDESGLGLILEPEQDLLTWSNPELSRAQDQKKVLNLSDAGLQDFTWYVDGILQGRTNAIRLTARDYKPGVHYLSVSAYRAYGEDLVPWSTELIFTVID